MKVQKARSVRYQHGVAVQRLEVALLEQQRAGEAVETLDQERADRSRRHNVLKIKLERLREEIVFTQDELQHLAREDEEVSTRPEVREALEKHRGAEGHVTSARSAVARWEKDLPEALEVLKPIDERESARQKIEVEVRAGIKLQRESLKRADREIFGNLTEDQYVRLQVDGREPSSVLRHRARQHDLDPMGNSSDVPV